MCEKLLTNPIFLSNAGSGPASHPEPIFCLLKLSVLPLFRICQEIPD